MEQGPLFRLFLRRLRRHGARGAHRPRRPDRGPARGARAAAARRLRAGRQPRDPVGHRRPAVRGARGPARARRRASPPPRPVRHPRDDREGRAARSRGAAFQHACSTGSAASRPTSTRFPSSACTSTKSVRWIRSSTSSARCGPSIARRGSHRGVPAEYGQRHRRDRARPAAGSGACDGQAARRRPGVFERRAGRVGHANRRAARDRACDGLWPAACHDHQAHGIWRGPPGTARAAERPAGVAGRGLGGPGLRAGSRARVQHRRHEPAVLRRPDRAAAGGGRARRLLCRRCR